MRNSKVGKETTKSKANKASLKLEAEETPMELLSKPSSGSDFFLFRNEFDPLKSPSAFFNSRNIKPLEKMAYVLLDFNEEMKKKKIYFVSPSFIVVSEKEFEEDQHLKEKDIPFVDLVIDFRNLRVKKLGDKALRLEWPSGCFSIEFYYTSTMRQWNKLLGKWVIFTNFIDKYSLEKRIGKGGYSTVYLAKLKTEASNAKKDKEVKPANEPSIFLDLGVKELLAEDKGKTRATESPGYNTRKSSSRFEELLQESLVEEEVYFAAKVVKKETLNCERRIDYMEKELNLFRKINHPHIVQFRETFETKSHIVIVSDFVSGGDLYAQIKTKEFSEYEAFPILKQIGSALRYLAERHVVHRDLKPPNILVNKQRTKAWLTDFGLGVDLSSNDKRQMDRSGTVGYMAPEVLDKDWKLGLLTEKSDIFSLGIVAYEMYHFPSLKQS